ncbi:NUDIX domain-containing protein [Paraburkholderia sp. DHOC27]|uniref:NUDIX domain-containing protein n=1 Tax=Paraburkholderia sp. DHOC27 TaxID=2303330 RepID=UPI000E3E3ACB|nr:NUDIX hydrolase [Paraburkholderia sp. DHOC27]RFU45385.1 NUDIX hydrolase [Paraburkholderia sp. DHOC27]
MPSLEATRPATLIDAVWRLGLRVGFRLARIWWHIRRPRHEGALVALYVGEALLLVKSSYRAEWNFPGGSMHAGEPPEAAAQREMEEEIGLPAYPLVAAGSASGNWDGRKDKVYFFELHLDGLPELQLDNREIVAARLALPDELHHMPLTDAVVAYLARQRAH